MNQSNEQGDKETDELWKRPQVNTLEGKRGSKRKEGQKRQNVAEPWWEESGKGRSQDGNSLNMEKLEAGSEGLQVPHTGFV